MGVALAVLDTVRLWQLQPRARRIATTYPYLPPSDTTVSLLVPYRAVPRIFRLNRPVRLAGLDREKDNAAIHSQGLLALRTHFMKNSSCSPHYTFI